MTDLLGRVTGDVWSTMAADWPYLLLSILAAALVPVYVGTGRLSGWLSRRRWLAIGAAVLLATLTRSARAGRRRSCLACSAPGCSAGRSR